MMRRAESANNLRTAKSSGAGKRKPRPDLRPLPLGWVCQYDKTHEIFYYVDVSTSPPNISVTHPADLNSDSSSSSASSCSPNSPPPNSVNLDEEDDLNIFTGGVPPSIKRWSFGGSVNNQPTSSSPPDLRQQPSHSDSQNSYMTSNHLNSRRLPNPASLNPFCGMSNTSLSPFQVGGRDHRRVVNGGVRMGDRDLFHPSAQTSRRRNEGELMEVDPDEFELDED